MNPATPTQEKETQSFAEAALRSRVGGHLERWEMARKVKKLARQTAHHAEAAFDVDWCKGHFGDHGQLTLSRYDERLHALGARLA